jgi:ACS family glucarate transporter-like MFS transporter
MRPSQRSWLLVLLLSLVSFMAYFLRTSITVAQEQMVPELGLTFGQMGVITGIGFQLAYSLGQIPAGIAGDWYGARRVLGWALVLFAIATFATGIVPSGAGVAATFAGLLAARALLGTAQAATYPVGSMAIAYTLAPHQRATANGIYIGAANLATALVPLTLAPLMVAAGWRAVFTAGGVLTLLLAFAWYRWAPDVRPDGPPPALKSQLATLVSLVRNRDIFLVSLSYLLHSAVFFVFVFWFFRYLIDERGMTILASGIYASIPWFAAFAIAPVCGWLADRVGSERGGLSGRRRVAMGCMLIGATLMSIGIRVDSQVLAVGVLSVAVGILTGVEGSFWAVTTTFAAGKAGSAGGVLNLFGNLGGVISIWAVPQMVDQWGWLVTLSSWAGVSVTSALLWTLVRERRGAHDAGREQQLAAGS